MRNSIYFDIKHEFWYGGGEAPPTSFSPVTSKNVGFGP